MTLTGWQQSSTSVLIADGLLEIGDGYRAKNSELGKVGIPFARVRNVQQGFDFREVDLFPVEDLAKVGSKRSRPGDCVISMKGSVGRVAFVKEETPEFVYSPQLSYWRSLSPDSIDPGFLRYWMQAHEFQDQCAQVKGSTDMADYVNLRDQRRMRITLPPVFFQRRVSATLGAFDTLIDGNRRRIEVLEEMARLLYREWFINFRFPGHENVDMMNSEIGKIPDQWSVEAFSQVVEINPKVTVSKDKECPFFTMGDLSETGMLCTPSELRAGGSGSKFARGDTLFARITPCLENGKTGFVQNLADGAIGRGSTEFIVFRGSRISEEMTYLLAREPSLRGHAAKSMVGASGRQRVRNESFDSFLMPVPPPRLVDDFTRLVRPMFELVSNLGSQNDVLCAARDLLLPRLVSGELDVSELDLDAVAGSEV